LEIPIGDSDFWDGQLKQLILDSSDKEHRCFVRAYHPDLCGFQFGCGTDFISSRFSFRSMGQKEYPAGIVRDFFLSHILALLERETW